MRKLAVIAGTPVDTKMGVDYINKKGGFEAIYSPAFSYPRECHVFQMAGYMEKRGKMENLFNSLISQGVKDFFIYCNSLSASFDYDRLAADLNVKCVTPLNAYEKIAKKYQKLAVIAANNQATGGIEKVITNENPACYVHGMGLLDMVEAIEKRIAPAEIVSSFKLYDLLDYFKALGCEALVLGCTHFPYLKEELEGHGLEIIDPAEIMYELLG